jgi:hypothetical protein
MHQHNKNRIAFMVMVIIVFLLGWMTGNILAWLRGVP